MMPLPNFRAVRDARRAQRYPTNFPGELAGWRGRLPVTVTDISRWGALLKADDLPQPGQEVTLVARSLEVTATVAWNKSGLAGLCFHHDIEPLEVVRQNVVEMRRFRKMRAFGSPRSA